MDTDYRMDLEDHSPLSHQRQYSDDGEDGGTPFLMDEDDLMMENGLLNEELDVIRNEFASRVGKVDQLETYLQDSKEGGAIECDTVEYTPPENFSPVVGKIYRSSFPRVENFQFLSKLGLKSILVLVPDEIPLENLEFLEKNGIKIFQVGMSGNKEPFVNVPPDIITKALEVAIDPANHPLLIHCNRGKHRTGCLVGCIRRLQGWSLTMILDEYRRFAAPKARPLDQQFIEMYGAEEIIKIADGKGWLPLKW